MNDSNPTTDLRLRRLVHELNTPVGVGAMAASMLPAQMDSIASRLDAASFVSLAAQLDEWRETVALVQSSLQLCVRVLANSSAACAVGRDAMPVMDLFATAQQAVAIELARRPELQISCHLHISEPMLVHGDSSCWQQVLGNLVSNSLLHGFDGCRHGTIQIAAARLPGSRVLLHYYDDGHGLSEEAHARLFEGGYSTRIGRGGHGLGMGIVRDLVHHKMAGRVEVHRPASGVHISIEAAC
jgi:signal transduction histidine kinase